MPWCRHCGQCVKQRELTEPRTEAVSPRPRRLLLATLGTQGVRNADLVLNLADRGRAAATRAGAWLAWEEVGRAQWQEARRRAPHSLASQFEVPTGKKTPGYPVPVKRHRGEPGHTRDTRDTLPGKKTPGGAGTHTGHTRDTPRRTRLPVAVLYMYYRTAPRRSRVLISRPRSTQPRPSQRSVTTAVAPSALHGM